LINEERENGIDGRRTGQGFSLRGVGGSYILTKEETMRKLLGVAVLLAVQVACADVDSQDILTNAMYANLSITADGSGDSEAVAALRVGGANSTTYVELSDGDTLTAQAGDGEPDVMTEAELFEYHAYHAVLPTDDPALDYTISFVRTVDEGALGSILHLPDPFEMDEVSDEIPRSQDVPLNWTPADAGLDMTVVTSGTCVEAYSGEVPPADGAFDIPALVPLEGEETNSCEVTVTLRLIEEGSLDPHFGEGGQALGYQVRSVNFLSTPAVVEE